MRGNSAAAFALAGLLACVSPVWAEPTKTKAAEDALSLLRRYCLSPSQTKTDFSFGGVVSLLNRRGGEVQGSVTLNRSDGYGVARMLTGREAIEADDKVRQCIFGQFPELMLSLEERHAPIALLVDSPGHPYRTALKDVSGTNADDIWRTLMDMRLDIGGGETGFQTDKETVGPEWQRERAVLVPRPALVVIHFSAFEYAPDDPERANEPACSLATSGEALCNRRFFDFARRVAEVDVPLVVYSRNASFCTDESQTRFAALLRELMPEPRRSAQLGKIVLLSMAPVRESIRGRPAKNVPISFLHPVGRSNLDRAVRAALEPATQPPPGDPRVCIVPPAAGRNVRVRG